MEELTKLREKSFALESKLSKEVKYITHTQGREGEENISLLLLLLLFHYRSVN